MCMENHKVTFTKAHTQQSSLWVIQPVTQQQKISGAQIIKKPSNKRPQGNIIQNKQLKKNTNRAVKPWSSAHLTEFSFPPFTPATVALAVSEALWFSPLTDPPQRWVMIQRLPSDCSSGVSFAFQHLWGDILRVNWDTEDDVYLRFLLSCSRQKWATMLVHNTTSVSTRNMSW